MAGSATEARTRSGKKRTVSEVQLRLLQVAKEQNLLLQRLLEREPTLVRCDDLSPLGEPERLVLDGEYLNELPPFPQYDHLEEQQKSVFQEMSQLLKRSEQGAPFDSAEHMTRIMEELHDLDQDPSAFRDRSKPDVVRIHCRGIKYTHEFSSKRDLLHWNCLVCATHLLCTSQASQHLKLMIDIAHHVC